MKIDKEKRERTAQKSNAERCLNSQNACGVEKTFARSVIIEDAFLYDRCIIC